MKCLVKISGDDWKLDAESGLFVNKVEHDIFHVDWMYTVYPPKDYTWPHYPNIMEGLVRLVTCNGYALLYSKHRYNRTGFIGLVYTPVIHCGHKDDVQTEIYGHTWKKLSMTENFIDFLWNPYYAPIDIKIDHYNWFRSHFVYEIDKSRLENSKPIRAFMGLRMIDGQLCMLSRKRYSSTIPLIFRRLPFE